MNRNSSCEPLVSIIMPTYNCEKYISESIESVISQTYNNWELLIVDDNSNDNTSKIVESFADKDDRIKYKRIDFNQGPATTRNIAIKMSSGDFTAFLDSDDIWMPDKLDKQISFMLSNGYNFSCTAYERVNDSFLNTGSIIYPYKKADYNRVLYRGDPIGNSTAIYNNSVLGKFTVPEIKKRNDFALWLKILKKEPYVYGMQDCLARYRVRTDSISHNKMKLIKYHWILYKKIEKLSVIKTSVAIATLFYNKTISLIINKISKK